MTRLQSIFGILCVAAFCALHAAAAPTKQWSDGPLQWSDFRGTPTALTVISTMKVTLEATPRQEEGTDKVQLAATAMMWPEQSTAILSKCDDQRLRYHQLQFDLLEYYRRCLQDEINMGMSGMEVEKRLRDYRGEYASRWAQIERETEQGANDHRLQDWEYTVRRQLDELGLPPVPRVTPGKWCYGIYAGVGAEFPTGQLKNDFGGSAIFQLGLTAGYRRVRFKADIAYGQPGAKNNNIFNVPDSAGYAMQGNARSAVTHLLVGAQLGYTVYNGRRLAITPGAGFHYNVYSWEVENYTWPKDKDGNHMRTLKSVERKTLHSFQWIASVDFDIRLHSHVTNTPMLGGSNREQFTSNLRITPWVARASFKKCDPAARGTTFGVTVCYLGLARLLSF